MSIDTETHLITPGNNFPKLVCGSAGWLEAGPLVNGALLDKDQTLEAFAQACDDSTIVLGGANIAYDLGVIAAEFARRGIDVFPWLFAMLEDGRVYDLQIAQALDAIAEGHLGRDPRTGGELKNPETGKRGSYSLSMCVDLVLGRQDAKANDEWRLRYGELDGVPMSTWPVEARDYPVDDARNSHETALAQVGVLPKISLHHNMDPATGACTDCGSTRVSAQCFVRRPHKNLHEVADQTYSAFCLQLGDARGLRVDQSKVDIIEAFSKYKRTVGIGAFVSAGVVREDESENQAAIKRLVAIAYGATETCPHCDGKGKIPHPEQPTLRCTDCKGRCQPWKSGGTIKAPTVLHCATCNNTARVPHPVVKLTGCIGPHDAKTCDGTGLVLTHDVPRSEGGGVSFGRDALHESGDEFLMSLGDFKEDAKVLKDYVPFLRTGRVCVHCGQHGTKKFPHAESCPTHIGVENAWRDVALTFRSNAVLETGRVSYRGYIQLLPRAPGFIVKDENSPFHGAYIPSLRECFVARDRDIAYFEVPLDYVLQPGEFIAQGAFA